MSFITWNDRMATGVSALDAQHRQLIATVNALHDAMKEKRGREVIERTLDDLIQYVRVHFVAEEELLEKYDYPDYPRHKAEHDRLAAIVRKYQSDLAAGRTVVSTEIMMFLHDWIVNHTTGLDREYGPFLNQKGIR